MNKKEENKCPLVMKAWRYFISSSLHHKIRRIIVFYYFFFPRNVYSDLYNNVMFENPRKWDSTEKWVFVILNVNSTNFIVCLHAILHRVPPVLPQWQLHFSPQLLRWLQRRLLVEENSPLPLLSQCYHPADQDDLELTRADPVNPDSSRQYY